MINKGKRQLNFEILRIVAMAMIVCLHYLGKGGILGDVTSANMSATGYAAWFVESFCIVAVNVYVLISGYFNLGESSVRKPFRIWTQVLFYSIVLGVISLLCGIQSFDIYRIVQYVFPIVTEHYWFATAYIFLGMLMPFLNAGIGRMDKKQTGFVLGIMLLVFSVSKTLLPLQFPWDDDGYNVLWFIVLYLTGAYVRKFGTGRLSKRTLAFALYVVSCLIIFISLVVLRLAYLKVGVLRDVITYSYSYNYLFGYLGAVGLFVYFANTDFPKMENLRKPIEALAKATFGVYLIHEHINIRYLWPTWFGTGYVANSSVLVFIVCMVVTVLVVYLICSLIEILRERLWELVKRKSMS